MGAVTNMRPDLFEGVLAEVPFVDVVTTMLDQSIPLTTGEFDEWGDPEIKEHYDYMLSYSPYDRVETKPYPAPFVTTGLHDSQVQYFEPAKWVAKLRTMKTDDNPLVFRINMEAGHGGQSGRFSRAVRSLDSRCPANRHRSLSEQQQKLNEKLRGHYACYGVTGNGAALSRFRWETERRRQKWLCRRNRLRSPNRRVYRRFIQRYPLAPVRTYGSVGAVGW